MKGDFEVSDQDKKTVPRSYVVGLARELYDRFVMGGWEPQDSYDTIEAILSENHVANPRANTNTAATVIRDSIDSQSGADNPSRVARNVVHALRRAGMEIVWAEQPRAPDPRPVRGGGSGR